LLGLLYGELSHHDSRAFEAIEADAGRNGDRLGQSLGECEAIALYLLSHGRSETEIALANREQQPSVTELPIVLWNYGLIDLEKLGEIFDWIEKAV
jgi:Protein of unknown function (DUF2949)